MAFSSLQPGKTQFLIQETVPGSRALWKNTSAFLEEGEVESMRQNLPETQERFKRHEEFYYGRKNVGKLKRRVLKIIVTEVELEGITNA